MLHPDKISEVKRLLGEGGTQRAIARQTGVSRVTVGKIARGERPDYREREPRQPEGDRALNQGTPERCTHCGAMVHMPCLACKIERLETVRGFRMTAEDGQPLRVELDGPARERYEAVRARKMAEERSLADLLQSEVDDYVDDDDEAPWVCSPEELSDAFDT